MKQRNKLLTNKEVQDFEKKFMDLSVVDNELIFSFEDARLFLNAAKEQQIPMSGHDYYTAGEDGNFYPQYEMMEKYVDDTQPGHIDKFIDTLFDSMDEFSKGLDKEELYINFTYPHSSCPRTNRTAAIDASIRLTPEEQNSLSDSCHEIHYLSQYVDHPTEGELIHFKSDLNHEFYYNPFTRMVLENGVYKPLEFGLLQAYKEVSR
jgi:hypothetical protein